MAKAKQDAAGPKTSKRSGKGTSGAAKGAKAKSGMRRRLGRGLESLISAPVEIEAKPPSTAAESQKVEAPAAPPVVDAPVSTESAPATASSPSGSESAEAARPAPVSAPESVVAESSAAVETPVAPPVAPSVDPALVADAPASPAISDQPETAAPTATDAEAARPSGDPDGPTIQMLRLPQLKANPKQPRRDFDEAALEQLANSIRSAGVMQPIVVRQMGDSEHYEIVAGERRFRAATLIGLERIPAVIHEVDDRTAAEWALVENLQREDLNPIERGEAFRRLIDDFGMTHQEVAETVGLERSSVTNHLRLVDLDPTTRDAVRSGELGMGHGRALLAVSDLSQRAALATSAMAQHWSVRELERRIRVAREPRPGAASASADPLSKDPVRLHMDDLERRLGEVLGTRVAIQTGQKKGTGRLSIAFYSIDQFEGILERLGYRGD